MPTAATKDRGIFVEAALIEDMSYRDEWLRAAIARHLSPAERHLLYMAGELMDRLAAAEDV